eukprot:TRINITY_DN2530_c0_g2_i10.p1 TRINITY_DN2530_c0_g2~~TRINITY_DN2530_c0_g2_i10.p1  ORF type:complete len:195 (-),score=60.02 TRINITY_DN2530_c0_g2_i10:886-1470(-)
MIKSGDTFVVEKKIVNPEDTADTFGIYLGLSGDHLIVGDVGGKRDGENTATGVVNFFTRNQYGSKSWGHSGRYHERQGSTSADLGFGRAVAISGLVAVAGGGFDKDGSSYKGFADVFNFNGTGWQRGPKLVPSGTIQWSANAFYNIAIKDDLIAVPNNNPAIFTLSGGRVTIFQRSKISGDWHERWNIKGIFED